MYVEVIMQVTTTTVCCKVFVPHLNEARDAYTQDSYLLRPQQKR